MIHVSIKHNFNPDKFMWLWAKYVIDFNPKYHCTNCIKGSYSKKFSKSSNANLINESIICFDEVNAFEAIYICGVSKNGYKKKENYPHNVHIPIKLQHNSSDEYIFEDWAVYIENGQLMQIPDENSIPHQYKLLPKEYTTCRIFRWASTYFENRNYQ